MEWNEARAAVNNALTGVHLCDLAAVSNAICHTGAQVDRTYAALQHANVMATTLQMQLGLESPWEVGDEQYTRYKKEIAMTKYRCALDELEHLVVMRLFELSKLSLSGTGM